jgi:hypothetical protein
MKKGDDDVDDEDDYAVRTRVSQEQVTATLCTEELFPSTQYICLALPAYQGSNGGYTDGQNNSFSGLSWFSHLPAGPQDCLQSIR